MDICRRLFVVPLANNDHGKTKMIRALVNQGQGSELTQPPKRARDLRSPTGRWIDAYIYGRSFQEIEKGPYQTVEAALDANDPDWRKRELIIVPSHVHSIEHAIEGTLGPDDVEQMIACAHEAGFDAVCASVIFDDDRRGFRPLWTKNWDIRWTVPNPRNNAAFEGQLEAIGRDLWFWICKTMFP